MGFKLPGKSMTSGTSAHSSALKMRTEQIAASALKLGEKGLYASDMSWKEGTAKAETEGNDLNALKTARNGFEKGSFEYNKVQNKINSALGNKKRYDEGPAASDPKVKPTKLEKATKKNVKVKAEADENLDKRTAQLSKKEARKEFGKGSKEHLEAKAAHLTAKESDRQGEKGGRKQGIFRKASSRINERRQKRTKAKLAKFGEVQGGAESPAKFVGALVKGVVKTAKKVGKVVNKVKKGVETAKKVKEKVFGSTEGNE